MDSSEKYLNTLLEYLEKENYDHLDFETVLRTAANNIPEMSDFIYELLNNKDNAENWFSEIVQSIDNAKVNEHYLEPGDKVGSYQVSALINRGGMSQIYLAERVDGEFEQTVVIKVMDARLDSEMHIDYFKQEKMILASLNHPNIGKIFDGGMLDGGQPYYIMEYVEGSPVTEYADQNHYNFKGRIQLFLTICKAVSYAHKNLIIHKDLKPQNIFVDINGHIKLLDFGVADSITHETKDTDFQALFVTRKYASPEMLKHQLVDISSDIYQLGLVLYEMLTGALPENNDGKRISLSDKNLKSSNDLLLQFPKVKKNGGELMAILQRALAENPEERYQSVTALQNDLEDYLQNRPIHIYSNSIPYLIKKFTKRNPLFSRAFLVFVFLTSGLTFYHTQSLKNQRNIAESNAIKAEKAAARSEANLTYLKNLFYEADPYQSTNKHKARFLDSVLLMAYSGLDAYNLENTAAKADILITLADVLRSRGHHQRSLEALKRARKIMTQNDDIDEVQFSRLYYNLASTYIHEDYNVDSAIYFIRKAIAIDSLDPGIDNQRLTWDLDVLGRIYGTTREYHKAAKYYRQSLERLELRKPSPKVQSQIASTKSMLGEVYLNLSKFDSAEVLLKEALHTTKSYYGEENAYYLNILKKLSHLYEKLGKTEKLIPISNKAFTLSKKLYGDSHPKLISIHRDLGLAYAEKQNYDFAIFHGKRALQLAQEVYGVNHVKVAYRQNTMGIIYEGCGMLDSAVKHHRLALNLKKKHYPDALASISIAKYNLASAYLKQQKSALAIELLEDVVAFERKSYGEDNATVAITERLLSQAYIDEGDYQSAEDLLRKVGKNLRDSYKNPHRRIGEYLLTHAELNFLQNDLNKSYELALQARDIYHQLYDEDSWRCAFADVFSAKIAEVLGENDPKLTKASNQGIDFLEEIQPRYSYYYKKLTSGNLSAQ